MGFSSPHNPAYVPAKDQGRRTRDVGCGFVLPFVVLRRRPIRNPQSPILGPVRSVARRASRAFTLIEMLIVITITLLLVAASLTTMRPALESRRTREAARAIDVYLGSARNRAMETGRPCGVMLYRFSSAIPGVMNAALSEQPPCYCGDTEQSTAQVTYTGGALSATLCASDSPYKMLRSGDLVQFNCQGPRFSISNPNCTDKADKEYGFIQAPATGNPWVLNLDVAGQTVPWTAAAQTATYRIYRSPGSKLAASTLQLPAGATIDLDASGIDNGVLFNAGGDPMILFSPNGSVDLVYLNNGANVVTQPIFLLVGKREKIPAPVYVASNPETYANYRDVTNLWVVINPQTGMVYTDYVGRNAGGVPTSIDEARQLARQAVGMGGR